MKNLQSKIEGTWIELKQVQLTEEQINILKSGDTEAQTTLNLQIKKQIEGVAEESDILISNVKYAEIKPLLRDTDVYELITIDISIDAEKTTGILNCRVNGEHKQIRF
jgi:hypothetical protein